MWTFRLVNDERVDTQLDLKALEGETLGICKVKFMILRDLISVI